MKTKYGFEFSEQVENADTRRLVNQMWKLIPMREKDEDWQSQLIVLVEEISGLEKIYNSKVDFIVLLSKLEGLTSESCKDFMVYRKTIFRCIQLLTRLMTNE